jgi:hypothetical protein
VAAVVIALPANAAAGSATPTYLVGAFMCIHHYEGSWNDPNPPYYGGLQMDWTFMATYGAQYLRAWGPANNWPVSVQIAVAIRAYLSGRGFYPWPVSARLCGLI